MLEGKTAAKEEKAIAKGKAYSEVSARGKKIEERASWRRF